MPDLIPSCRLPRPSSRSPGDTFLHRRQFLGTGLAIAACSGGAARRSMVALHPCPRPSLAARLAMIDGATDQIDVAYYSVDGGRAASTILHALVAAADRGVRVRVILDGLKSRLNESLLRYLSRRNVAVRIYHPPCALRPFRWNRRYHGKLIVADRHVAMFGSRNLEDAHFALDTDKTFVDSDVLVHGSPVGDASAFFNHLWQSCEVESPRTGGVDFGCGETDEGFAAGWRRVRTMKDAERKLVSVAADIRGVLPDPTAAGRFEIDAALWRDCSIDKFCGCFMGRVLRLIDSGRRSIVVESPYPAFGPEIESSLLSAARRGVAVTLLTNSLRSTDQINVYAAYQNRKRRLIRAGVRLREYAGDAVLHAKTIVVDGRRAMVGSYNFDTRSDRLNLELGVYADDPVWASAVAAGVRRRLSSSVSTDQPSVPLSVGPDVTMHRRAKMAWGRAIAPVCRKHY